MYRYPLSDGTSAWCQKHPFLQFLYVPLTAIVCHCVPTLFFDFQLYMFAENLTVMAASNERIELFVLKALSDKRFDDRISIGTVSEKAAAKIKEVCGYNLHGYSMALDARHIRHVLKRHPQISLKDFLFLRDIINNHDSVAKSKTKGSLVFKKRIFYEYTCVEAVLDKSKMLNLKTFWVKRKKAE